LTSLFGIEDDFTFKNPSIYVVRCFIYIENKLSMYDIMPCCRGTYRVLPLLEKVYQTTENSNRNWDSFTLVDKR